MTIPSSSKFTTISDLGYDASVRYAKDQKSLSVERQSQKVAGLISSQAEVDVHSPYPISEFDTLFETRKRNKGWATFSYPPGFSEQKARCFTFELLPGSSGEKYYSYAQSIREKVAKDHKTLMQSKSQNKNIAPSQIELDKMIQFQEEEKQGKILFNFFGNIKELNDIMMYIEGRRNQFQKA